MEGAREGGGDEDSARTGRAWPGSPPAPALALVMWWKKDGRLPGTMRAVFDLTHGGVACQTRVAVGSLAPILTLECRRAHLSDVRGSDELRLIYHGHPAEARRVI